MLKYFFMQITGMFSFVLVLGLAMAAHAQVYETTDEQGNVVFTDMPPTDEAIPVKVDATNIADSVEVRPPEPKAPPAEPASPDRTPPSEVTIIDNGDDDLREDLYEYRRRDEVRDRLPDTDRPVQPVAKPGPHPVRRR